MVAEELPELPVLLVPAVCAAIGFALFPVGDCAPVREFPAVNDCPTANW
jgi:hypothetical protein